MHHIYLLMNRLAILSTQLLTCSDLEGAVTKAAVNAVESLGFILKQEQLQVVVQFALGHDVFACYRRDTIKACVISVCFKSSIRFSFILLL